MKNLIYHYLIGSHSWFFFIFLHFRNQSKASVLMLTETQESNLEDVLKQVAFSGAYTPANETVKNIEQVTKDNVVQVCGYLACIYSFKVNNRNTRKMIEICWKLSIDTRTVPLTSLSCSYFSTLNRFPTIFGVFVVDFAQ